MGYDPAGIAAAVDPAHILRLSAVIDGAKRAWLSSDLGVFVPAEPVGGADKRAGPLPPGADLHLPLRPRDREVAVGWNPGGVVLRLRRVHGQSDGERVDAERHDVAAANPHPRTESVREALYSLPAVGLRGVPDVGAQRDRAGVRVGGDNGPCLRLLFERGRDGVGIQVIG